MGCRNFYPVSRTLRELTGAKDHERKFRDAIAAGLMRRAYLKGVGQNMKCSYPARPLTPAEAKRVIEMRLVAEEQAENGTESIEPNVRKPLYTSDPVVQKVD